MGRSLLLFNFPAPNSQMPRAYGIAEKNGRKAQTQIATVPAINANVYMIFKMLHTIFSVGLKLLLSHKTGRPKKPVTKNKIARMRNLAVLRSPSFSNLELA